MVARLQRGPWPAKPPPSGTNTCKCDPRHRAPCARLEGGTSGRVRQCLLARVIHREKKEGLETMWSLAALLVAVAARLARPVAGGAAGEYGGVYSPQVSHEEAPWILVELEGDYESPVLFGAVPSDTGDDETVVRFRNLRRGPDCAGWCFDLRVEEPSCRDGVHDSARVGWMALEEGVFSFASQRLFADESHTYYEVGKVAITSDGGGGFVDVDFDPYFLEHGPGKVTVVTHVQTSNIAEFVKTRQGQRSGQAGFRVALDTSSGSPVGGEVVGWLGMPSGSGFFGGYAYRAETATDMVAHQSHIIDFGSAFPTSEPYIFANIASFDTTDRAVLRLHDLTTQVATVYIGADQCPNDDASVQQGQKETVHFLALPGILGHASILAQPANVRTQAVAVDGTATVVSAHPYQLYSNGRYVGNGGGAARRTEDLWEFQAHVRSTVTVLAISAQPGDSDSGGIEIEATVNGAASTRQWRCSRGAEIGWEREDFDDSTWPLAVTEPGTQQIWANGDGAAASQVYCRLSTPVASHSHPMGQLAMGEKGSLSISSEWRTVELNRDYRNPVVFGGIPSYTNAGEAAVRVRGIRNGGDGCHGWCFDIRLQEPACRNDRHAAEYASWLVAEAGTYLTDENSVMQIGEQAVTGDTFHPIQATGAGNVIFTQLQTSDAPGLVRVHVKATEGSGFAVALEASGSGSHAHGVTSESVGWLMMDAGAGHIGGLPYFTQAGNIRPGTLAEMDFGNRFSTTPLLFGSTTSPTGDGDTSVRIAAPLSTTTTQVMLQQDECATGISPVDVNLDFLAIGASAGIVHAKTASVAQTHITATEDISSRIAASDPTQFIVTDSVMRFTDVQAEHGHVARARIRLVSSQDSQHPSALEVRAYANDSCTGAWLSASATAARVLWTPSSWSQGGEYWSPDVSSIVDELTQRPGWRSGNSICVTMRSATKGPADETMSAAFAQGNEQDTPLLSIVSEPCGSVDCGDNGFCVSGTCRCLNSFFGNRCENPPGPPSLCDPIKERYLPLVSQHCTGNPCAETCMQLSMPLYGSEPWLWRRFSTVCNLRGAVADLGLSVDCTASAATNFSEGYHIPASVEQCTWHGGGCVATLDENVMAAVAPRRGDSGSGKGFQACFAASDQDACEVMDWCWWLPGQSSCEPRTNSMLTVALAALSQWDPLYDATLDPHGHFLHLADECGRHSEHVCGVLRSCEWSPDVSECVVASVIVSELMKSPSCSATWEQAATCRGRPSVECVGQCSWSGAVETCMLSTQMNHVALESPCSDQEQCVDDAWGMLDSSGLTCHDLLSYGTCSYDLSNIFASWPAGVTISSICQASCGECGDPCVDQDVCPELLQWWSQSEGGGCASGGTLSESCPRTCGLCKASGSRDDLTPLDAAEADVAAAYGSSASAIREATASQMQYGIAAIAARGQECAAQQQSNCTASAACAWNDEGALCVMQSSEAMSLFLGEAGRTPLGASLLRWSQATEDCALLVDEATCVASNGIDATVPSGTEAGASTTAGRDATRTLAPLAAVAGLLTVWAFGSLVLGRNSSKKQKVEGAGQNMSFGAGSGGQFKSPLDSMYDDANVVKLEPASTAGSQPWADSGMYDMTGRTEVAELPGMGADAVPWSDYMDTGASTAPFNLPFLGSKSDQAAADSPWEDTGSDTEAYSSGGESMVGGADSPYSDYSFATPETDVASSSTPPNLASVHEDGGESLDSFITGLTYEEAACLNRVPEVPAPQPTMVAAGRQQPSALLQAPPATMVGQAAAHTLSAAANLAAASVGGATGQMGQPAVVQLPAATQTAATKAKRGQRKRKLTEQKKEAVTGVVFMLCRSGALPALEQIPEASLRSRYSIDPAAAQSGVLLRYGADSKRAKLLLATALNDVFRALDWDLAQPAEKPVKWGTIQRDILWKYQKREGCDSVYLFSVERATLESYAAAIEERLPKPISELLKDTYHRVEAAGVEMAAAERARGGAAKQLFHCPVEGCDYSTPERRYIMGHMRVHTGHKPFKCEVEGCGYASYSSQHLTRHARVHSGERPFKCTWPNCGYAASQKGHLQSHMLKHTGQRPFRCTFAGCDFACTRSWHLERHKRKHGAGGAAVDDNDEYADVSEDEAEPENFCQPVGGGGASLGFDGPVGMAAVGIPPPRDQRQRPPMQPQPRPQQGDWAQPMMAQPAMAPCAGMGNAPPVLLAPPARAGAGDAAMNGTRTPPLPASLLQQSSAPDR